ncbi:GCN5 family acetyltransferase [Pseudoalteromonas luteoviolacea]|uniref:GCN5 family acetyltransferase n=1 Tax=Pseudoalteromonas luteoviolacea TaxID=43657 RepID=A0A1C0TQG5_9GAMM|nr:GNAT family protein [Pseudoalteromonas luteoviolacea]MBQ4811428.1 GNAT family N-acetyltransferase [Pseudoalteromonas luteoviolacea]OCQ21192.1 GCN5 family acetyltransferase [Pseudoalteromonas luteoviolacea]
MWLKSEVLEGANVVLEPIKMTHVDLLTDAVQDGNSWELWYASVPSPEQMHEYVEKAVEAAKNGAPAYVVKTKVDNKVVGTTRFYDVQGRHRRASIGYTWYANAVKKTVVNTECKYLLIKYLFDTSGALSLEFKTHFFNQTSRTAIERLGAKLDGVLRSHQVMQDGSIRDTAIYSILAHEWPSVKNNLLAKIERYS